MTDMKPLAKITPVVLAETRELGPPEVDPLSLQVRRKKWIGFLILFLFFGVGGGWASFAPLRGAVLASGVVSPEGQTRTVQHLEGGIIEKLLVSDGDKVKKGQPLLVLSDIKAKTLVNTARIQLISLAAKEARLKAEVEDKDRIVFDHPALQDRTNLLVQSVIERQRNHFETRRALDSSKKELMTKQILQAKQQIVGLKIQLKSTRRQLELTKSEREIVAEMVKKGYEKMSRLINLQSHEAELEGTFGRLVSDIAKTQQNIAEIEVRLKATDVYDTEQTEKELSETQEDRRKAEETIKENLDQLARTRIVAPVDGTILNLRYKTIGGIITAGKPILDIVPDNEQLVIEARVSPKDIDDVRIGQPARIMFPSYPQRFVKRISGVVDRVSADTVVDDQSDNKRPYYLTRVRVDPAELHKLAPQVKLEPGLPAEAFIETVQRTLLDYILDPVVETMEHAFREK